MKCWSLCIALAVQSNIGKEQKHLLERLNCHELQFVDIMQLIGGFSPEQPIHKMKTDVGFSH